MRIFLKKIFSKLRLIPLTDYLRSRWKYIKLRKKNKNFLKKNPAFIPPPLELAFDAYGHIDYEFYENSGKEDAAWICEYLLKYTDPAEPLILFDWGCGPARVLKHIQGLLSNRTVKLYGSDYNKKTYAWCKNKFQDIHFSHNDLKSPLSYPSSFFDAVYGLSVLTHLSIQMNIEWLKELKRILKPKGVLILTTHGNRFRHLLSETEKQEYDSAHFVVRDHVTEGRRGFAAFHSPQFLKNELFKDFHLLEHITDLNSRSLKQDIWVLKNKSI